VVLPGRRQSLPLTGPARGVASRARWPGAPRAGCDLAATRQAKLAKEFSRLVSIPGLPVRSTSDGGWNGRPPEQFKEMQCGRSSRD
jgi:hypothetical protein